jgi:diguanylate cyclase (GGDEF)-like protein/PAS domain S-box-containing protein
MRPRLIGRLWSNVSLAGRLMMASGTVLAILGVSYSVVVVRSEINFHLADLRQTLKYEFEFLSPAIAEPAVTGDYALIKQMITSRARQPDIVRIRWIDTKGSIIDSGSNETSPLAPSWFARWLDFPLLEQTREIIIGDESYGKLQVLMTTTPATNNIWDALQKKLEILLFGIGIMFALTLGIVTNGLRPLYTLRAIALRFGQGEHSVRMPPIGPSELSTFVQAFNNMAGNIENLLSSLRESDSKNRLLAVIVEQSNVAIITKDLNGIITSWNSAASAVYGYSADEMIGESIQRFYPSGSDADLGEALKLMRAAKSASYEARRIGKNGNVIDVHVSVSPLYDEDGVHVGEISVVRDITRQKEAEDALFKEKERAQVTLASIADAVITTDTNGNIEYLNPVAEKLLGWHSEEAYGHALPAIFHAINEDTGAVIPNPVEHALMPPYAGTRGDAVLVSREEIRFPIEHSAAPIFDSGKCVIGAVLVFRDVSVSHNMARQLTWQASHDTLTSLANRREFERRLESLIETAHAHGREHALLYMDLDQFKVVNDTGGHVAGDELLRQLSTILNNRVRSSDTLARLGGDEFGVLLADCPLSKAMEVAETLRQTVEDFRFIWQEKTFAIGASIGVVAIVDERQNNDDVLAIADAACYLAKDKGRNRVQANPNDHELSHRRGEMQWVSRINNAFEEKRFLLHYQRIAPIQCDDQDRHYEALLRMVDSDGKLVSPMAFIPAAERYNLMRSIDRQVIAMAFDDCRLRAETGIQQFRFTISINLSGDSLSDDGFLDYLKRQIAYYGVSPQELCFEVTETAAIANLSQAVLLIKELRSMGCRFSLDDFGSGLSSFGYLKNLPVDYLKIDGSFVRDMVHDPIDAAMVGAINDIGHVMGIKTIAEWVEDQSTVDMLRNIGVDFGQGYYFEKPQPMQQILAALTIKAA